MGPSGTARFTTSILPKNPEEARAFLQKRLAFLGKVSFLLTLGTFTLSIGLMLASGAPLLEILGKPESLLNLGMGVNVGALWLLCGERLGLRLPMRALVAVDAFVTVSAATFVALVSYFIHFVPGSWVLPVLAFTQVVFIRTVVVPSTATRTLLVSGLSALPVLGVVHSISRLIALPVGADPLGLVGAASIWIIMGIAGATISSRVIYGLRERALEAMALGQYTLVEKIGEGGMGVVYRAKHALLRRPTAVKLLLPEKAGPRDLMRFEREVQLTSRLSHPNTIAIYDYGHTPDGIFYYAMEYLEGMTLEDLVEKHGPAPAGRVIHILLQVASALREAHGAGLIHRDIKPANIFLCDRGGDVDIVKVLDFGLVKDVRPGEEAALTLVETIAGTPYYLAPEAAREPDKVDARADLYALGAVGYFLLTGKVVFEGKTVIEICGHHLHSAPVPPSARVALPIPADLEAILMRCLAKKPAERLQSASDLRDALAACQGAGSWGEEEARAWWDERKTRSSKVAAKARDQALAETLPAMPVDVRERVIP